MDLRNVSIAPPLNEELLTSVAAAEGEPHSFFLYFFPFLFGFSFGFWFWFFKRGFLFVALVVLELFL